MSTVQEERGIWRMNVIKNPGVPIISDPSMTFYPPINRSPEDHSSLPGCDSNKRKLPSSSPVKTIPITVTGPEIIDEDTTTTTTTNNTNKRRKLDNPFKAEDPYHYRGKFVILSTSRDEESQQEKQDNFIQMKCYLKITSRKLRGHQGNSEGYFQELPQCRIMGKVNIISSYIIYEADVFKYKGGPVYCIVEGTLKLDPMDAKSITRNGLLHLMTVELGRNKDSCEYQCNQYIKSTRAMSKSASGQYFDKNYDLSKDIPLVNSLKKSSNFLVLNDNSAIILMKYLAGTFEKLKKVEDITKLANILIKHPILFKICDLPGNKWLESEDIALSNACLKEPQPNNLWKRVNVRPLNQNEFLDICKEYNNPASIIISDIYDNCLKYCESSGHLLLSTEEMIRIISNVNNNLNSADIDNILNRCIDYGLFIKNIKFTMDLYQPRFYYDRNLRIAKLIKSTTERFVLSQNREEEIELKRIAEELRKEFTLNDKQYGCLQSAIANPITIITGKGGTGKTLTATCIVKMLESCNINVVVASHMGSVVSKLKSKGLDKARTVYKMIAEASMYVKKSTAATTHPDWFEGQALLIDEFSTLDTATMFRLLSVLPALKRIIVVMDHNQIAPIGAGCPYMMIKQMFEKISEGSVHELNINMRAEKSVLNLFAESYLYSKIAIEKEYLLQQPPVDKSLVYEPLLQHQYGDQKFIEDKITSINNLYELEYGHNATQWIALKNETCNTINTILSNRSSTFYKGQRVTVTTRNVYAKTVLELLPPDCRIPAETLSSCSEFVQKETDCFSPHYGKTVFKSGTACNGEIFVIVGFVDIEISTLSIKSNFEVIPKGQKVCDISGKIIRYVILKNILTDVVEKIVLHPKYLDPSHLVSAYCITVNKAQSHEFPAVCVYLPPSDIAKGAVSKEHGYVALSRSKQVLHLLGDVGVLEDLSKRRHAYRLDNLSLLYSSL
jgi:hypothetical protein